MAKQWHNCWLEWCLSTWARQEANAGNFLIALCTIAWDYRDELFAPDENWGKSIFHFLLGLHSSLGVKLMTAQATGTGVIHQRHFKANAEPTPLSLLISSNKITSEESCLRLSCSTHMGEGVVNELLGYYSVLVWRNYDLIGQHMRWWAIKVGGIWTGTDTYWRLSSKDGA